MIFTRTLDNNKTGRHLPERLLTLKYAIPVYYGFPPRPYRVLGSLEATTASGMNAVGYAASKAKALGADAVIFQTKGTQIVGAIL
jgi:hypothetical protein